MPPVPEGAFSAFTFAPVSIVRCLVVSRVWGLPSCHMSAGATCAVSPAEPLCLSHITGEQ